MWTYTLSCYRISTKSANDIVKFVQKELNTHLSDFMISSMTRDGEAAESNAADSIAGNINAITCVNHSLNLIVKSFLKELLVTYELVVEHVNSICVALLNSSKCGSLLDDIVIITQGYGSC